MLPVLAGLPPGPGCIGHPGARKSGALHGGKFYEEPQHVISDIEVVVGDGWLDPALARAPMVADRPYDMVSPAEKICDDLRHAQGRGAERCGKPCTPNPYIYIYIHTSIDPITPF